MPGLDLADVQGMVLRGYRLPVASYTFLRITDPAAARQWVGDLFGHVTTAAPWNDKPASTVNVAFTAAGLAAIGLPADALAGFPEAFRQGMASRAVLLGDAGASAPVGWEQGLGSGAAHVLVLLAAGDEAALAERVGWLDETLERAGLQPVHRQQAAALSSGAEHFGYADGFSQPDVDGLGTPARTGQAGVDGQGGWRPIAAGEFVLGYADEEEVVPPAPSPDRLSRGASYLVYRKLRQDVPAFRAMLAAASRHYPGDEELLAAKLVGRWRDGTPLELSPDRPDPALAADFDRNNAFDYADDPDGFRCPIGAHVRRANPRNSLPFAGKLVNRHRLMRRGLTYGPELPPDAPDDGADRGVVFLCFNADITRQFEFVQSQWLNDGNAFRLGDDKDVLTGDNDGTGKMTVNGRPPYFVHPLPALTQTRGGEYLFTPGLGGLRYLAELPAGG